MQRRFNVVLVTAIALVAPGSTATQPDDPDSAPPVVTFDRCGTFVADGQRFFPIGLTMPPPLGSRTPWGRGALPELVRAGVTLYRTGAYVEDWTDATIEQARRWNAAAAAHGVYTWVNLRELARATPGSKEEQKLRHVVEALRNSAGMGFWKGLDEPWPRLQPAALANAYRIVKRIDPNHAFLTIFAPRCRHRTMLVHAPILGTSVRTARSRTPPASMCTPSTTGRSDVASRSCTWWARGRGPSAGPQA